MTHRLTNKPHRVTWLVRLTVCSILLLAACSGPISPSSPKASAPPQCRGTADNTSWSIGEYRVIRRLSREPDKSAPGQYMSYVNYEITQRGHQVFAERFPADGDDWIAGYKPGEGCDRETVSGQRPIVLGRDLTGDGQPNVALYWRSGGSCGCQLRIFSLGQRLGEVGRFDQGCACPRIEDLNRDGRAEVIVPSHEFATWCEEAPVNTPAPVVVHEFRQRRYQPAVSLMKKRPASEAEVGRFHQQLTYAKTGTTPCCVGGHCAPAALWSRVLRLIHSGRAAAAWEVARLANFGVSAFKRAVIKRLRSNPQTFGTMIALNGRRELSPSSEVARDRAAPMIPAALRELALHSLPTKRTRRSRRARRARRARRDRRSRR